MRTLLDIDDHNLLHDRSLRNHFEHYDERIDEWFKDNRSAVYTDLSIQFQSIQGDYSFSHRAYDPITLTLSFRGDSFDLAAILKALEEIRHKCRYFALP